MAVRSVPVKRKLVQMVETNFPGFRFQNTAGGGIYGFVREKPGYWYEFLPIIRFFEDGKGDFAVHWHLIGGGYVPDWYEWAGLRHTPWRVSCARGGPPQYLVCQLKPDPNEPPSLLAAPGPDVCIRYQTGPQAQLDQALEVLRDKLERYAIPALAQPLPPAQERQLQRWQRLAQQVLPQLEWMRLHDPEGLEVLRVWQKQAARRNRPEEDVPPVMARWREEARALPGFAGEWDSSPILQSWVFNWFTHAMLVRP